MNANYACTGAQLRKYLLREDKTSLHHILANFADPHRFSALESFLNLWCYISLPFTTQWDSVVGMRQSRATRSIGDEAWQKLGLSIAALDLEREDHRTNFPTITAFPEQQHLDNVIKDLLRAVTLKSSEDFKSGYANLIKAGNAAYARTVHGTVHAGDCLFGKACPEIFDCTIRDIKSFADKCKN